VVKVIFYNLLRSKYHLEQVLVSPGTITDIFHEILVKYPQIESNDLFGAMVFDHGKAIHQEQFSRFIVDLSEIIVTHFVGGG